MMKVVPFLLACLVWAGGASAQQGVPVIPRPERVESGPGSFTIPPSVHIVAESGALLPTARQLAGVVRELSGSEPNVVRRLAAGTPALRLALDPALGREAYRLSVTPTEVRITGGTAAGVFYGVQTLRQMLPEKPASALRLAAVEIEDAPRFGWRGMHLDVSRHFLSKQEVERFIDYISLYKFNRLHFHLTDDQGWRLEIRRYPALTREGAWRTLNDQDRDVLRRGQANPDFFRLPEEHFRVVNGGRRYGGFYTQAEMREIIAYAAARHVTVVPEIDMPGHMQAAIAQYPELSCTGTAAWGETFSVPLCPGKEEVYRFVETVIGEVASLFPSEYIHIGGDEVEKTTWANHPGVRDLMAREGLDSLEQVQSAFLHRVERMLNKRGKRMIGWDEIVEGGLSPTATVMFWRGWAPEAPLTAARRGNDVIMSPTSCCYFDSEETDESLRSVYDFEPVPSQLTGEAAKRIIGVQANLWSERIPNFDQLEYMAFPRMLALSEVAWTRAAKRDWSDFEGRMAASYPRLDALGINYRLPPIPGLRPRTAFLRDTVITLTPPVRGVTLRYTTDGSVPTAASPSQEVPVRVAGEVQLKVRAFYPDGLAGPVEAFLLERQSLRPADSPGALQPGVRVDYHPGGINTVRRIRGEPASSSVVPGFVAPAGRKAAAFALVHTGYVRVPADGVYTFTVASDDGSALYIGDRLVVDNDGPHSRTAIAGQVALQAGLHPIRLLFFEGGGGYSLDVTWEGPGVPAGPIPAEALFHRP